MYAVCSRTGVEKKRLQLKRQMPQAKIKLLGPAASHRQG
jgi:hypothetical protein